MVSVCGGLKKIPFPHLFILHGHSQPIIIAVAAAAAAIIAEGDASISGHLLRARCLMKSSQPLYPVGGNMLSLQMEKWLQTG